MIALAASLAVTAQAATVTGTARGAEPQQMIGTVNAVDADTRRVTVITGCGHALRVMVFQIGSECRIEVGGVVTPAAKLRRGQIVVVRYRNAAPPYDAESITTRPAPDAERPR
jgi:Cu/Ag efflux protein CusF